MRKEEKTKEAESDIITPQHNPSAERRHPWYYSISESMTNASIDCMIALDGDSKIIAWNNAADLWTGHSFKEITGKNIFEVYPDARNMTGLVRGIKNALRGLKSFLPAGENSFIPGHFETHIVPLRNWDGEVQGSLQILHDVSHRVKAENELKALNRTLARQNAALIEAHEELAAFSKMAAHDLKDPLRKIYTFVELIMMHESAKLSNAGRTNFRRIQKSVQRMGLLTDDILNFSGISRSQPKEAIHLGELLDMEKDHLRESILETGAQIQSGPLPAINGYPAALIHIFRQLLSNALKFRKPDVPPVIRIGCERINGSFLTEFGALPDQQYFDLWFADNGIGFPPEESNRIFELFYRLHPDGLHRGNGMGLAIVRKVVRMHEGFVSADSRPGEGSIFHCYLPAE
jgi:PAS domain S-box-containing protein